MSIDTSIVAKVALESARLELNGIYPSKSAMAYSLGRASAANFIDPTVTTQSATNEIGFLIHDYARRHGLYK